MGLFKKLKTAVAVPIKGFENKILPVVNSINNYLDKWFPQDKRNWRKIAIRWSIIQALIIGGLEIYVAYLYNLQVDGVYRYVRNTNDEKWKLEFAVADPLKVYQMIFLVAQFYQFYLICDTVTKSSTIQLLFCTIFNIGMSLYSIIQYRQAESIKDGIAEQIKETYTLAEFEEEYNTHIHQSAPYEIGIVLLMIVFCIGWIIITLRLYKVFGWNVFKQLGADIGVKNRLKLYQVLLTLLKIDIFLFSTFTFQFVIFVVYYINNNTKLQCINIALLIVVFIMPFIGFLATKKENYKLMCIFIIFLSVSIGYMTFSIADIISDTKNEKKCKVSNTKNCVIRYRNCRISLSIACISSILVGILTFILALINFKNFPKGLNKNKTTRQPTSSQNSTTSATHGKQQRWSIE